MRIYYWKAKKNFGDQLTALLLSRFCRLDSEWSEPEQAELVATGSILEHLPRNWKGVIAGAGKLHEKTVVDFPNAKILALRGYLSAKGIKGDYIIADPGLLADELVGPQEKIHSLGLVPHWTDTELEHRPIFKQFNPKVIRVGDDPLKVITEIGSCKKIVSSSLHGVILADAFGIPRRIEMAPRMISHPQTEGGLFKWQDYLSSIDMKLEIGLTQIIKQTKIIEKQHELYDMFQEIRSIFSQKEAT